MSSIVQYTHLEIIDNIIKRSFQEITNTVYNQFTKESRTRQKNQLPINPLQTFALPIQKCTNSHLFQIV